MTAVQTTSRTLLGGDGGLLSRLSRLLVGQLLLISLLTLLGVYAAAMIAEKVLVDRALQGEASYFWAARERQPTFPAPSTMNLQGYVENDADRPIPDVFKNLALGRHRLERDGNSQIVHISEQGGQRLVLQFSGEAVSRLALYFGVVPLALILLVMYGGAFFTYWSSRRAISPVVRLADTLEHTDLDNVASLAEQIDDIDSSSNNEARSLQHALSHFLERTHRSLDRERQFSRYASHELRTPLAVIRGSLDALDLTELPRPAVRARQRIRRAAEQMQGLIDSLLMLTRNEMPTDVEEAVDMNTLVDELMWELQSSQARDGVSLSVVHQRECLQYVPEPLARMVVGNLIRNAVLYTEVGEVTVTVDEASIVVADTGPGLTYAQQSQIFEPYYRADQGGPNGHGLGLALVKHVVKQLGWSVTVDSTPGKGSRFTLYPASSR